MRLSALALAIKNHGSFGVAGAANLFKCASFLDKSLVGFLLIDLGILKNPFYALVYLLNSIIYNRLHNNSFLVI